MIATREDDAAEGRVVKPTRVLSAWSVFLATLPLVATIVGASLMFWKTQGEDQRETKTTLQFVMQTMLELKAEVKAANVQFNAKIERDARQDQELVNIDKRLTRLEDR